MASILGFGSSLSTHEEHSWFKYDFHATISFSLRNLALPPLNTRPPLTAGTVVRSQSAPIIAGSILSLEQVEGTFHHRHGKRNEKSYQERACFHRFQWQAKEELKAAMKAFILRRRSLDNELLQRIRTRDFDWDSDMRRMLIAVKVSRTP